jgi:hypothetical protein
MALLRDGFWEFLLCIHVIAAAVLFNFMLTVKGFVRVISNATEGVGIDKPFLAPDAPIKFPAASAR